MASGCAESRVSATCLGPAQPCKCTGAWCWSLPLCFLQRLVRAGQPLDPGRGAPPSPSAAPPVAGGVPKSPAPLLTERLLCAFFTGHLPGTGVGELQPPFPAMRQLYGHLHSPVPLPGVPLVHSPPADTGTPPRELAAPGQSWGLADCRLWGTRSVSVCWE